MNSFSFLFSSVSLSVSVAHYQILRVTSMNFFLTFHLYHYQWLHLILDHCDSQTTVILSPSVDCGECESWLYLQTCTVFLFLSVHTCLTLMTVSVSGSGYGHGESWAVPPPPTCPPHSCILSIFDHVSVEFRDSLCPDPLELF